MLPMNRLLPLYFGSIHYLPNREGKPQLFDKNHLTPLEVEGLRGRAIDTFVKPLADNGESPLSLVAFCPHPDVQDTSSPERWAIAVFVDDKPEPGDTSENKGPHATITNEYLTNLSFYRKYYGLDVLAQRDLDEINRRVVNPSASTPLADEVEAFLQGLAPGDD